MEHEDDNFDVDRRYIDSALGNRSSIASSTQSLPPVLPDFWEENGRMYYGNYYLPTDDKEYERQEYQYKLCRETFGTLSYSYSRFHSVHRVLDVGCGLGLWGIGFAELHPEAEVFNVDIAPCHLEFVPPNVRSQTDDLEEQWTFSSKFSYIHAMMMYGAFSDWPAFYAQSFRFLESDGWVEVKDMDFPLRCIDGSLPADSALQQWSDCMVEASTQSGFCLNASGKAIDLMREAGFVDVEQIEYKWPVGSWPKDKKAKKLGTMVRRNLYEGVEAMSLAFFTRFLHWSPECVRNFVLRVQEDIMNPSYHAYFDVFVTYGRKK